jgi:hypothetical protein
MGNSLAQNSSHDWANELFTVYSGLQCFKQLEKAVYLFISDKGQLAATNTSRKVKIE